MPKPTGVTPHLGDRVYCYLTRDERRWVEKNKHRLAISLSEVIRLCVLYQIKQTKNGIIKYKTEVEFENMLENEA